MDDVLDSTPDLTPEYIRSFLGNIRYPETLDDIIREARRQYAPQPVVDALSALESGLYESDSQLDFYLRKSLY